VSGPLNQVFPYPFWAVRRRKQLSPLVRPPKAHRAGGLLVAVHYMRLAKLLGRANTDDKTTPARLRAPRATVVRS
jgi:hypothetical protein